LEDSSFTSADLAYLEVTFVSDFVPVTEAAYTFWANLFGQWRILVTASSFNGTIVPPI
jgi:hypothetical protein